MTGRSRGFELPKLHILEAAPGVLWPVPIVGLTMWLAARRVQRAEAVR